MSNSTSVPPTVFPAQIKCDRYYTENNKTHFIYGGYEGIPENLLINFIVWIVLIVLFSLLRRIAWDYGRIALVSRTEARGLLPNSESRYNVWTSLFYGEHGAGSARRGSQESLDTRVHQQDKGFCSWLRSFFFIKEEHILQKCGYDAIQYLSFQRYLLFYTGFVTIICISVILPINFQGTLEGDTQAFGHTTISNIKSGSLTLWVHSSLAIFLLIVCVVFMRHFSVNLHYEDDEQTSRTLMVMNIPRDRCFKNLVTQHFREAYPDVVVEDVQFAYNISKLSKLNRYCDEYLESQRNAEIQYKLEGHRPMMLPRLCGHCCLYCACCRDKQIDAIDYYSSKVTEYRALADQEKIHAFQGTLGIAFITLSDDNSAISVYRDFRVSCKGAHNPHSSSVSRDLGVHNWEIKYAPGPDNICWENLAMSPAFWWLKAISINFLLFIGLFFLTTPSIIMNLLNQGNFQKAVRDTHNPLLVQFLPTLILWAVSALLPKLVYWSDQGIGHWTKSAGHHSVMRKTFFFLLMMVLVLPSLGLTSAKALFEWFLSRNENIYKFRWQCIFLPDNGAFFVNYVITAAFIGTAAELIRIPELLFYSIRLLLARSAAERTVVRKAVIWEFQFGAQYAWMLSVFSVIMAYSMTCPLITPFGLVYLAMKHLVDRYNIYFAYAPSRIDKNIHATAINFVIVAVIILLCSITFFIILRAAAVQGIVIFSLVAVSLTLVIFFGRLCFGWFKGFSPIRYKKLSSESSSDKEEAGADSSHVPTPSFRPFIPNVLLSNETNLSEPVTASDSAAVGSSTPSSFNTLYGSTNQESSDVAPINPNNPD